MMAAKFHLCLLLIILGTIAVQGARQENPEKNTVITPSAHFLLQFSFRCKCFLLAFDILK